MDWHFQNIVLYPRNSKPALDAALFAAPTAEYRGTPFWAWNTKLDRATLLEQIDVFQEMGLGGFHMHPRTGLATEYMGEEFLGLIRDCTQHAKERKMISWLYDEDRWPSGAAGGLVTKDHALRARHLLWTSVPYDNRQGTQDQDSASRGSRQGNGKLLGRYEILLQNDLLAQFRQLKDGEKPSIPGAKVWYAYLEVAGNSSWFNNQAYVDTLNPKAIAKFVEITHERYAKAVGDFFGNVIPAIFTDEPQFVHKGQFNFADEAREVVLPFTDDFFATFAAAYGQRLEDFLPELFWELPDNKPSVARYRYHDHVAERFAAAFADTCGKWGIEHKIALTGHMMEEPTLQSQTAAIGDAMRSYRSFQLPGIDLLCDRFEFNTAKQAQSAAHQFGRPGVLSELYGVTNWDFDFAGHKGQGDWQAALGITVRVPHLAWVSMAGEAKRDYPAAIDYHSPWYREYPLVEDHFARVNVALTRGEALVRVGVVHPVESYWLDFGPYQQTRQKREDREAAFTNLTNWLLFGLVDFDFLCESLLPLQCQKQTGRQFVVGQMKYDKVIVPAMRTIRGTTLDELEQLVAAGGQVIFAGEVPSLVDAIPSDRAAKLAAKSVRVDFTRQQVMNTLEDLREVDVRLAEGGRAGTILHQIRQDGDARHIFFCNTDRIQHFPNTQVRIRGNWKVEQMDTFSGKIAPLGCSYQNGWTIVSYDFAAHGHLLLTLRPGTAAPVAAGPKVRWVETGRLVDPVAYSLSEPNVLVLDQAQWRLGDSGAWQPVEELLRLDNLVREKLKLEPRVGRLAQPWIDTAPDPVLDTLQLRFTLQAETTIKDAQLALEDVGSASISLDEKPVKMQVDGYWVDQSIGKVALPVITAGKHELVVSYAYSRKRNIEWMYLLGTFGVAVAGRHARLIASPTHLAFGDFVTQGLPFYAGNVTYHFALATTGGPLKLHVPHFKGPLLAVMVDGKPAGKIAFAPFELDLSHLPAGNHKLDITVYGNRVNAFSALHCADKHLRWFGPGAWRLTDWAWSYEYQLRPMGILTAPILRTPAD